jgi:hypothetical protein
MRFYCRHVSIMRGEQSQWGLVSKIRFGNESVENALIISTRHAVPRVILEAPPGDRNATPIFYGSDTCAGMER